MRIENKLDRSNVENFMSLTSLQQGMLFHYINDKKSTEYHEQLSLTIDGDLKLDLLEKAWNIVIENNEMLRTIFRWKGIDKPIQIVLKKHKVSIQYVDFKHEKDKDKAINEIKTKDLNERIDITRETLRIYLCKLDENIHEMIISNHHILYDGWSNGIILKELIETYSCLYENKEIKIINKTKFSEFIKYVNNIKKNEEKKYWSKYMGDLEDKNDCFSCNKTGCYKEVYYEMDESKTNKIKDFAKENKVLLSSILYGAWGILLQKISDSNEVLFGTVVSGRPESIKSVDKMVGLFINTVPLIVKSENNTKFIELINELDLVLNERKSFENTSLVDIKEYCNLKANEEFFNSIVTIENYPLDLNLNKENILKVEKFSIIEKTNYNMALEILAFHGIEFKFNFNDKSIDNNIVEKFGNYLERIIESLLDNPNITVNEINLLSAKEVNQILYEFNNTKSDYPKDKTIQDLFEEQVKKTPDNIALVFKNKEITYKELNEKANQLARSLREEYDVKNGDVVAIHFDRSTEMVIGIIATLKINAICLPIETKYPIGRVSEMLIDSNTKIVLNNDETIIYQGFNGMSIKLDKDQYIENDKNNLRSSGDPEDLAYLIYTSGSTGKPKAVKINHKGIINHAFAKIKETNMSESDICCHNLSFNFVASIWQIFSPMFLGSKVYLYEDDIISDGYKLFDKMEYDRISIVEVVPALLNLFLELGNESRNNITMKNIKKILLTGEKVETELVNKFYNKYNVDLINAYGQSEFSDDTIHYHIPYNNNTKKVLIGKPTNNTRIYILDKLNKIVPVGIAGEICISGDGIAKGYINNEKLTSEKFVKNPYEVDNYMYKTGDLAKWLPDGNIEFLGRIDQQVKIRGFRIELEEIQSNILRLDSVKECIVIDKGKEMNKYLCAYYVSERELKKSMIKEELKKSLPYYMIPSYFIKLEKMPLTLNGKIDRKKLLNIQDDTNINTVYEAPRNKTEEKLVKVWSEVLDVKKVGINDDFFDLGGHSLKATVLMSKIHKELKREIPLKEIFKSPTIKELSKLIESSEDNHYLKIEEIKEEEYYEASSAQKRMYMLQKFDKDSTAYNMPVVFELEGKIDKNKIEEIFKKLIIRHEGLKTCFETYNGEIIQKLQNNYKFKLVERKEDGDIDNIINKFIRPFNLEKAPLFRVELVKNKEKTYLLIDMHHIISDGVSMSILIKEFTDLYNEKNLETLRLQYKDFAAWQNNFLKSEQMKKQEEYWINKFSDEIPVLNIPIDYERPSVQSHEGDSVSFEVDKEITSRLRKLAKETKTTMHMVLLSAFTILLSKYSNQEDIIIGTPIAGRPHADLQNIMGMFVNTLALRNKPEGNKKYIDFLKEVKENSLKAYENQSYQLEALVEKLDIRRDVSRNPLFDVIFNMVDTVKDEDIKLGDILLKQYNSKNKISKFNLTLNAMEKDNKLSLGIEYCTKLFKKDTIERLSGHYIKILEIIINNFEIKLKEIDLLTERERDQILYQFNDTKVDYPRDKTIQELFEEQVEKTPDNIAVVFEDKKLTYKELNEKANRIARVLRSNGVKAESIVGIMVERSINTIVQIMGILKSGGAYLPIDPNYPNERIEYILKDSNCKTLLSERGLVRNIEFYGEVIDLFEEDLFKEDVTNLEKTNNPNNLAYIIYTSGTTGNPKGVMCEHKNVVRLVKNINYIEFKNDDKIFQTSSMVFDASIFEIFGSLLNGLELCLAKNETIILPELLKKVVIKNNITILALTSELFNQIAEENISVFKSLRYLLIGGDILSPKYINLVRKKYKNLRILNEYGPSENTTNSTTYFIDKEFSSSIPIGKPISNSKAYIIDKNNMLKPVGIYGELCVSGDGLARGYLNRPKLTAEKFIDNPFELGTKMYKTGDLARWLPDGNIEFLGRIDNQVKIRGFRIELGEIENRLLRHKSIKEAVVLVRESEKKEKYICAYIVSEKSLEELNLKSYLKEILPEYMVPAYFIKLEKMPLTRNGKLDRRSLPYPSFYRNLNEYEAPRNKVEDILTKIWSEVLDIKKIGINDNFFDLGGHSLKATVLMSKIHKELEKEISLKDLFKAPTIKELSNIIESTENNPYSRIEKIEEKEYYEASSAQKRMYMLQEFDKDSTVYNMPIVFELEGKMDNNKIEETFEKLIIRHEGLRTYFETYNGEIIQKSQNNYKFKLVERKEDGNIDNIINRFIRPFNLEKAPLFRVELVKNKEKTYLLIDMHHIISDGVSMSILIKEFTDLYREKNLETLKLQYKDFAAWQNNFLKSEQMKRQEEYWINRFSDEIPVLNIPTDYERPSVQSHEGDSVSFEVDREITLRLRKLAKETGTTMHMVMLSVFNILLSKYSGQDDIVIGTPIAGRPHADLQNIMGMFVNTLALRNNPKGNKKYIDFLKEVKENSLRAYENQSYQLEALVEKLDIRRDISRNPLFDVMFNMVDAVTDRDIKLDDIVLKQYNNKNKVSKFDLTLNVMENNDKLNFSIEYCTKLFKKETIEKLSRHYVRSLEIIINNIEIKLCEVNLLTEQEKNQILYEFNDTKVDYPKDKTIQELFEEQVEKTPNNIAVVFEDKKLTYRELNEKANSLARVLRDKGVKSDSIVGIMVERSIEMIVGIMGILKSGGAYLPIDPSYPKSRIEYILEDSKSKTLLSTEILAKNIDFDGGVIDLFKDELFNENSCNLGKINNSDNLAYIIYTSGTTGKPKGVMVNHLGILNLQRSFNKTLKIRSNDRVLQFASISFDASVWEIFMTILNGARLYIPKLELTKDILNLQKYINSNNITIATIPPNYLANMDNEKKFSLRLIITAGSKTNKRLVEIWREKCTYINAYGPTEDSICTAMWIENKHFNIIPIGRPILNKKIYILDKYCKLTPIGVSGELCISGDGLARGYLNNPELTSEKFVDNPFEPGERMYRTGDLARWLPDGNIEFLGRIDNQVKIRGFRIELGEIENRLLQHKDIKEIAVIVSEDSVNENYICAYIVSDKSLEELNLKNYLKEILPEYMIPTRFIKLEKMPLTSNGKLDRRLLPDPSLCRNLNEYEAPRNEIEVILTKLWSEVLGINKIGINDDFFDLGGHSLKATVLMSKIHKELNKEIPLKEIFKSPTIKELSEFIQRLEENAYLKIEKIEEKEYYEASSAQKRMYMLQKFDKDRIAYNMPVVFELEGKIHKNKIEETFKKLIVRHEALRTYFETLDGEIIQKLQNSYKFKLVERKEDGNVDNIINKFIRPFNLEKAPLFRVELVKNKEKTYLLIDMHHIISDGVSMSILIKEFTALYNGENLDPLKLQYKDFAAWQNNFLKSEEVKKQEEYWINNFSDEIPILNMITDYERPAIKSFEGDGLSFEVDEKVTENLRKIARKTGSTMNMVLISAFNILLSKYSGQEDIIIGTPIAGRTHADLQNMMGMFVNTLALRNKPKGEKKYVDFLKDVKENSIKAYENQSYQIEYLVEKLDIRRDTSRNPLFDVMFNMIDMITNKHIKLNDVVLKQYINENKISKFDLTLNALEEDKKLKLNFEYCSKLFKKETIERLSNHYAKVLKVISNNPEIKLKEIDLLTEKERNQILYEFNDTKVDYPKDKTIQELFEEQVEKTSNNIAVVFEDKKLTYRELNERANSLARVLRDKGVKADSIIGIMVERSLEMIVGIIGILKAGGAYLPIDPNYPKERIEYMLKDSGSNILLSKSDLVETIEFDSEFIDLYNEEIFKNDITNLPKINNSKDLAYIIYTSGTTGKPKGAMIEHRSLVNRLNWMQNKYPIGEKDTILQKTTYTFDVSVWEILWWALVGAKVCMLSPNGEKDPMKIIETINKYKVTTMHFVPSMLDVFMYCVEENRNNMGLSTLRQVFSSGEALNFKQVEKFYKEFGNGKKLINLYGPTEATIDVSYFDCINNGKRVIPIGKPIDNTKLYILKNNKPIPVGVSGELYIAGDGLARGYVNRIELTSKKFVDNPFELGTKMYKTGDLARWLPDGNIEFLARIDNQVKIRGFRIELNEIQSHLLTYEAVKEAAVIDREDDDKNKYICAYIVCNKELTVGEIREYLLNKLPEYMVPSYFIQIEKLPLTLNGKLDKKALPEPYRKINTGVEYEAPRNEIQEKILLIWREVLGVKNIGINDNFFELGGHSLNATNFISKVYRELNREIPLKQLFKSPTIKGLSKFIESIKENSYFKIEKVEEKEFYEASSAQKRMYTLQKLDEESAAYNMPVVMKIEGKLNKERLEEAAMELIKRHETLRTSFEIVDEK
ncbi:non-ribosomal peptide synthetase, partial [Clostridium botulinum]|uniref:non-ribosomal peptide synthetase n=1 Tax=Clostridium botulinum TaxID=1491 RepID=UPI0009B04037